MKNISIFIFHRDLRINDNTGLINCLKYCKANDMSFLPLFNITPIQILQKNNEYFSHRAVQFLDESLVDLKNQLKNIYKSPLYLIYGDIEDVIKNIKTKYNIDSIFYNKDLTPFATKRDQDLDKFCSKNNIKTYSFEDYTLCNVNTILTGSKTYFKKFTPFYNKAKETTINKPINETKIIINYIDDNFKNIKNDLSEFYNKTNNLIFKGGRSEGLKRLKLISNKIYNHYEDERNYPALESTTKLSPYIKYGCISIREVYHTILETYDKNNGIIRELMFRDFYYNVIYNNPQMLEKQVNKKSYNKDFDIKFDKFPWSNDKILLNKWKTGTTGYPIVDAGMRELVNTGYCHNRSRLITSSFLLKHLNIDWRLGERFYMEQLIDGDPINNNTGWTSGYGSGPSALAWFRIINPWEQTKKYDKDCIYIKKWIPELKNVSNIDILNWDTQHEKYPNINYPKPCVDHKVERENILKRFKKHLRQ
jgi:deoxyribodipyrimidine photo-lyase